tara:strand:+ start:145 stop:390 length:246 start_codon:yes stop_codon:yes gene_type:complete
MFSLIKKLLSQARSFAAFSDRLDKIESQLERYEALADENESLWQYLDEQKEMDNVWTGSADEFQEEISDMMVRQMKTQGDA